MAVYSSFSTSPYDIDVAAKYFVLVSWFRLQTKFDLIYRSFGQSGFRLRC